jgi:L-threonine-O-3-phosphate decarboxylase
MIEHGGNLLAAAERYGIAASQWLDLSTGISPYPYPVGAIEEIDWRHLPQESAGFRRSVTGYYGSASFLAVAGSQAAIQVLPRLLGAARVALAEPTYGEHLASWRKAGAEFSAVDEDDLLKKGALSDVVVVCNPNNPTGRCHPKQALLDLLGALQKRGGWLVVDEAFIDPHPENSLVPYVGRPGLVVLRSLGKFFGLAGARVGFLFAPAALLKRVREELGPWTVAGPSLVAATRALDDAQFHEHTCTRLAEASLRMQRLLERHGHPVSGFTDFFVWSLNCKARELQDRLARKAILVRAFDAPASLRFGLPGATAQWQRLEAALAE